MRTTRLLFILSAGFMMWMIPNLTFPESEKADNKKRIDVNCASIEQLCCLPEIDRQLAKQIVKFRVEKGLFKSKKDLLSVPGISAVLLEKLSPWLMEIPSSTCAVPDSHPADHDWEEEPVKNIPNC